ncbi:rod-binding protein [Sphingomonas sp.]|uniref:rod-binding protein n=1 Tax=Sphingomonas sp. TaxID=28214 RepID=UPI0035BBC909
MTPVSAPATVGAVTADTSRLAGKNNLAKAGQQFESVFTGMMLKSMRATHLADPLFDSKALDTFRDMQDQLTVKAMAEHTPLGIGKALVKFLGTDFLSRDAESDPAPPQPDLNDPAPTP